MHIFFLDNSFWENDDNILSPFHKYPETPFSVFGCFWVCSLAQLISKTMTFKRNTPVLEDSCLWQSTSRDIYHCFWSICCCYYCRCVSDSKINMKWSDWCFRLLCRVWRRMSFYKFRKKWFECPFPNRTSQTFSFIGRERLIGRIIDERYIHVWWVFTIEYVCRFVCRPDCPMPIRAYSLTTDDLQIVETRSHRNGVHDEEGKENICVHYAKERPKDPRWTSVDIFIYSIAFLLMYSPVRTTRWLSTYVSCSQVKYRIEIYVYFVYGF